MIENKTICLYDQTPYETDFCGAVLSCEEVQNKRGTVYQVVLDQTMFFPEEGGQSPDRGMLGGAQVLDVQIRKGVITHTLSAPLTVGEYVSGKVDWTHRFNNMQQHSGEHIFSGLVHERFGYDNVGFHLSDQIVTMDFSGPMTAEEAADIEFAANQVIAANVPILVSYPSREELAQMTYRSKIEIEGQVRIVTVTGVDCCACCAPHVRNTGEVGMLKIMNMQNYKGGVRISILCGFRALEAFREKCGVVAGLMNLLTTGQDQLQESVSKIKAANQKLSAELAEARQTLLVQKLERLPAELEDVLLFEQGIDAQIARNAVNRLVEEKSGLCGIFMGDDENGYQYVLASSSIDCKELAGRMRKELSARGGGSSRMIQGSVKAARQQIEECLCSCEAGNNR